MDSADEFSDDNDSYVVGLLDEVKTLRKQIEEDLDIFEEVDTKIEFVKARVLSTERELEMWKMFYEEQQTRDANRILGLTATVHQQAQKVTKLSDSIQSLHKDLIDNGILPENPASSALPDDDQLLDIIAGVLDSPMILRAAEQSLLRQLDDESLKLDNEKLVAENQRLQGTIAPRQLLCSICRKQ